MLTAEFFVVMLVAVYIGWIAVAAVRSNRRRDIEVVSDRRVSADVADAPLSSGLAASARRPRTQK